MPIRTIRKALIAAVLGVVVPVVGVPTVGLTAVTAPAGAAGPVVGGSLQCPAGTGTGSPGVTGKQINVGAISTLSGPISADFAPLVKGVQAYFDMVDAAGGVNGRKISLTYDLDDGGTPSRFVSLAHTVVDQDHAFAVIASSYFFNPTYFESTCTPTYGYNVTGDWAGPPNLFGSGGSVQTYNSILPEIAYLLQQTKSTSLAVLAYNVSSSSAACQAAVNQFKAAGYHISYTDLKLPPVNPNLTPDVQRILAAKSDFVLSCMTVDGNVALARGIKQYGLHVKQLWLNGQDQATLDHYANLVQGVYFLIQHVPLTANQKVYPGLKEYLSAMKKYEPAYVGTETAIQGWESAALLVGGIRAAGGSAKGAGGSAKSAGSGLTQANLVKVTNQMTTFTADGLMTPVDWTLTHFKATPPFCSAFTQAQGTAFRPVLTRGQQVFVCFGPGVRHPTPRAPKPGTPGPSVS
jgi:ABC-type branched-subunit amino acid transport system substrate-binding protein